MSKPEKHYRWLGEIQRNDCILDIDGNTQIVISATYCYYLPIRGRCWLWACPECFKNTWYVGETIPSNLDPRCDRCAPDAELK